MIKNYPFAVISNEIGARSETFIHRHMTELLPGRTVVVARKINHHLCEHDTLHPYHIIGQSKRDWRWFYRGGLYFLKLQKLSPVQARLEQYLKKYNVQVILSEYLDLSLKWLDVARKSGIRFFAHAHGYDISKTLRDPAKCQRYLRLKSADGIITISEYSRKKLMDIGLDESKIHVIPCGINVPNAPISRSSRKIIRCLAVGRMVAKKAPLLTIGAFQTALAEIPELQLDFIGDGALFEDVVKYVRDHALDNKITLYGSQPNSVVQKFMKEADIFIQHSRIDPETGDEEGLPITILEAMANSLPVVSTRHAGIPESVIEGATGFLVDEGDVEEMATHIIKLAKEQGLREQIGKAGWKRAKRFFSWEREKSALIELMGLVNI